MSPLTLAELHNGCLQLYPFGLLVYKVSSKLAICMWFIDIPGLKLFILHIKRIAIKRTLPL